MGPAPPGLGATATVLLVIAALSASVDWVGVGLRIKAIEYVCKPLTIALLVSAALALEPIDGLRRAYVATALVFSLAGDVLLVLPGAEEEASPRAPRGRSVPRPVDGPPARVGPPWFDPFLLGIAAFLIAQLNYIAGFRVGGPGLGHVALAALPVLVVGVPLGTIVVRSLVARGLAPLRLPLIVYIAVLCGMVASAIATGSILASTGAWLFLASDAALAWNRFVRPLPFAPVVVAVTYHVAQALLVLSLVR